MPVFGRTLALALLAAGTSFSQEVSFRDTGVTSFGIWSTEVAVSPPSEWKPGASLTIRGQLSISSRHIDTIRNSGVNVDGFVILATAERTFDSSGRLRLPSDQGLSTLLTPTGLPIEGGVSGAVTDRFGYRFRTPVDLLATVRLDRSTEQSGNRLVPFTLATRIPDDLPPGIYRVRLDYGFTAGQRLYSLNRELFAQRSAGSAVSHHYSPPLPLAGTRLQPRIPWVLLYDYNSNGYRGVVAEEDQSYFNLSSRTLIQDDIILPRFDPSGRPLAYSLEPRFPADLVEPRNNIPWNFATGELSIQITAPDGAKTDLGTVPFARKAGMWPTTSQPRITAWQPPAYGRYTVRATGWTRDVWGNRYNGGGTYHFWIAKRMTLAAATFPGAAYPVGSRYGRPIGFAPAVPAHVEVVAQFFAGSDRAKARTVTSSGTASVSGVFGPAQGMKPLPLDAPGEYLARILATYTDKDGHLWVCTMRHAGVVYPEDSPVIAHGKKLDLSGDLVDRGETRTEGGGGRILESGEYAVSHLSYPYLPRDVLLIATDQKSGNAIDPILTVEWKNRANPYAPRLNALGATNLQIRTSNHLSPHLFPEFINEWAYYYAGAPRPGLMARFLVAEDGVRMGYWLTSPNSFGGQINASGNGDLPGDIYRLLGGVVVRRSDLPAVYAGYLASAFILPKGTNNNRIIAPGAEDLIGPDGTKARFWLVGPRPGMLYQTGTSFTPFVQVDPVLPARIRFQLHYPDGRTCSAAGTADEFGSWAGHENWILDVPGVYRYTLESEWEGHQGCLPGLAPDGGKIYVVEKDRPAGAPGLVLNLPNESTFPVESGAVFEGTSTARSISYAAIIPGAVIDQGEIPVENGKFRYVFRPQEISRKFPTYDTLNQAAFWLEVKDVVHLTFFSKEEPPGGTPYHSFVRVIIRGNRILYTK